MTSVKATDPSRMSCDLLVVGSGASGLAAAVTAAWHGLKVIVVEKDPVFGGATAWSGGWMWVPGNPLAQARRHRRRPAAAAHLPQERAGRPLRRGAHRRVPRQRAAHGRVLRSSTPRCSSSMATRFPTCTATCRAPGTQGHQVIAAPYDGREVGPLIRRLRKTMRETSFMGMPIMAGADLDGVSQRDALAQVVPPREQALLPPPAGSRDPRPRDAAGQWRRADRTAREVRRGPGRRAHRIGAREATDRGGRRRARCRRIDRARRDRDSRDQGRGARRRRLSRTTSQRRKALVPAHADRPGASGAAAAELFRRRHQPGRIGRRLIW